jgi:hypothetical protein
MSEPKRVTRSTPYASCADFCQVFAEDMNSLYLLAFLLVANHEKAERCFVSGLQDVLRGNPVFKAWAHSWARRAVILNAMRVGNPGSAHGNGGDRPGSDEVHNNGNPLPIEQPAEVAVLLGMEPFERFVYVITVLERESDQECSMLLGCVPRDVVAARARAFQQIGSAMETRSPRLLRASAETPLHQVSSPSSDFCAKETEMLR